MHTGQEKKPQAHYGSLSLLMAADSIINKKVASLLNIRQVYWLRLVLWTECLCPFQFIHWSPNSQCDGI